MQLAECVLARVGHVEEAVLVLVLFVDGAHQSSSRGKLLIHEDEDGLLGRKLNSLADDVDELADGEVCRYQIFLLVDSGDVRFLDLLADDLLCRRPVSRVKMSGERVTR